MVPETLSRQTRQTRLALLLFSFSAIVLCHFPKGITVDNEISLLGGTVSLTDKALYQLLFILILYLLVSFVTASVAEKDNAGISPKELAVSHRIEQQKSTQIRIEDGLRLSTLKYLKENKARFLAVVQSLNKIYGQKIVHENHATLFERLNEAVSSEKSTRLTELDAFSTELEVLSHVDLVINPAHTQYVHSSSKLFGSSQHTIPEGQIAERSLQHSREISDKFTQAKQAGDTIKKISSEIISKVNAEIQSSITFANRMDELERQSDLMRDQSKFSLSPSFSLHYINYVFLEFLAPIVGGIAGLVSALILLSLS